MSRKTRPIPPWILLVAPLVLLLAGEAHAFEPGIHKDITREGMATISTTVDGGRVITFTDEAVEQAADANWDTDIGPGFFVGENHFTEEDFNASSQRLRNLKEAVVTTVIGTDPDGDAARRSLGTALHTVQDFYAHSNWIERSEPGINQSLGRSVLTDPPASVAICPDDPESLPADGGAILTTAYYIGLLGCGPIPINGKCYHGGPGGCDGIHKDNLGRPFHAPARSQAVTATVDYIEQILDDPRMDDEAKKCLLGITSGTLGMVIDDTGSMGSEISQVKAQVGRIVDRVRGTDDEPKQYLLVRFGDPDVGPPFATGDADDFLARVNGLFPSGGGDCPELSNRALLQALGRSKAGSSLFLFTDASAKDGHLAPLVTAGALLKRIKITPLLTGSCSPIDPSYLDIAEQTGGQLFVLGRSEVGDVFDLVEPQLGGSFVTLLLARDELTAELERYSFPVDSTIERLTVSASLSSLDSFRLLRPSGAAVLDGEPGVEISRVGQGRIVSVQTPETGTWSIEVAGSGTLSVAANANSPLDLFRFRFVERVNPIHRALAPIAGQPVVDTTPLGLAEMLGDFHAVDFELVDRAGAHLGDLDLLLGDPDASQRGYVGHVDLPSVPFRVVAHGSDSAGHRFQRTYPGLFRAQTVIVEPPPTPAAVATGQTVELTFTVTNLGPTDSFELLAADDRGVASRITPSSVSLATGESQEFVVVLELPEDLDGDVPLLLTATAVSFSDPNVRNSAALLVPLVTNRPPDCSAADDAHVELWPPDHGMVEVDLGTESGVTDPDGDAVTFEALSITQDEPVDGPGDGATAPDGTGLGGPVVSVRAERSGKGNGRVYRIGFRATDEQGATCDGALMVSVPHSRNGTAAVDDGTVHDSTAP